MDIMLPINVVLPLCIYLALGVYFNRSGRMSDATADEMNRLFYRFFFSINMFNSIYRTDLSEAVNVRFLVSIVACVVVVTVLVIVLGKCFVKDNAQRGSISQGIVRANSILFAVPVAAALCGEQNTGLATMSVAIVVPIYNVVCVVMLETMCRGNLRILRTIKSIFLNPIIIGAVAGLAARLLHIQLPAMLLGVTGTISSLVTPMALMLLGARLKFSDTHKYIKQLTWVSISKLVLVPALFVGVMLIQGMGRVEVATALAMGAVPTAVSSYQLARELGGDGPLAAQIVAVTSLLSVFTLFFWVLGLSLVGVI